MSQIKTPVQHLISFFTFLLCITISYVLDDVSRVWFISSLFALAAAMLQLTSEDNSSQNKGIISISNFYLFLVSGLLLITGIFQYTTGIQSCELLHIGGHSGLHEYLLLLCWLIVLVLGLGYDYLFKLGGFSVFGILKILIKNIVLLSLLAVIPLRIQIQHSYHGDQSCSNTGARYFPLVLRNTSSYSLPIIPAPSTSMTGVSTAATLSTNWVASPTSSTTP
jgi:hypothetical protein